MPLLPIGPAEQERLAALKRYGVLETGSEEAFDRITRLAARLLDAPLALIALIGSDRQWVKSAYGLPLAMAPTQPSVFCTHVLDSEGPFIVENALADVRFADAPLVASPPGIRFYAGAPLITADGFHLGTLCLLDTRPRTFPPGKAEALTDLAALVVDELELRRQLRRSRRAKAKRRASEARYRQLVEAAPDLIYRTDVGGHFTYVNPVAVRISGFPEKDLIGRHFTTLVRPDHQDTARRFYKRQLLRGMANTYYEFPMITRTGREIWIGQNVQLIYSNGNLTSVQAVARDITERHAAEAALRLAKKEAEAMSRAKTNFLTTMTHELRTPLNSVIGFANILRRNKDGRLGDQDLDFLGRISENGQQLLNIINEILDLSKIEVGQLELTWAPTDVGALIHDVVQGYEDGRGKQDVRLEVHIPTHVAPLRTDAGRLRQVLVNLVGNALKFTEHGWVRVTLHTDATTHTPLRIDIADTGIGIDETDQQTIFDAFRQVDGSTRRRYGGTGLGLALCRSICQMLGYQIELQSTLGAGSTFSVHLSAPSS